MRARLRRTLAGLLLLLLLCVLWAVAPHRGLPGAVARGRVVTPVCVCGARHRGALCGWSVTVPWRIGSDLARVRGPLATTALAA